MQFSSRFPLKCLSEIPFNHKLTRAYEASSNLTSIGATIGGTADYVRKRVDDSGDGSSDRGEQYVHDGPHRHG